MGQEFSRVRRGCYVANAVMAVVNIFPALLFVTFREVYGLSYTLLGMLVVVNFITQLLIDLIFSFFSHKFNIDKTVKSIPLISAIGFLLYAILPTLFPQYAYIGICIATIVVSSSSGLAEVLVSPVIAAIPAENPDREMSKLHAVYAWGAVGSTVVGTILISIFGKEYWYLLMFIAAILPMYGMFLFWTAKLPELHVHESTGGVLVLLKDKAMIFCVLLIFFCGSTEVVIAQWSSSYLEKALLLPKVWGDIIGVALFSVTLGLARSLYGKYGRNIRKTMLIGGFGASICYLIVVFSNIVPLNILALASAGLFTGMLWPGSLMIVQEKFPKTGVAIFALMAAGGDLGAAVGPQMMGIAIDVAIENPFFIRISEMLSYSPEQFGMRFGFAITAIFPILVAIFLAFETRKFNKKR